VPKVSRSEDSRLSNIVGALTLALADEMRDATERAAGQSGTAPAALVALHEFLDRGTMDQLRQAIGLTPSGAVRLVDRLVGSGYVVRQPGPDGRSVALVLTTAGRRAAGRVLAARSGVLSGLLLSLSDVERSFLCGAAETLLGAMTSQRLASRELGHDPSGGWICRLCDFDACGRDRGTCPTAAAAGAYGSQTRQ
jgi:MarR family transcriptional regulator, negative regulator of the multidrug operon emrRAB